MVEYEIGYGKPPVSGRFAPGVSGNPNGRPKRRPSLLAEQINAVLDTPVTYREGGRTKDTTYRELALKMIVDRARKGDIAAAESIPTIYEQAERNGDVGLDAILVENVLADLLGPARFQEAINSATARPDGSGTATGPAQLAPK